LEWTFNFEKDEDNGFCKLVCLKNENEKVIGLHYLGPNAGDVTQGFGVAIKMGATKADFNNTIGIHPSYGEELVQLTSIKGVDNAKKGGC